MSALPLTVRRYGTLDEVGERAWDDLAARSVGSSFFQGWVWNSAWWSARRDPAHRLVLLGVTRGERLVALAPLHLGSPNAELGRALSFLGQGNSDYQDVLVDAAEPESLGLLVEAIARLDEPWQRLLLYEIPEGSAFRKLLEEAERTDGLRLARREDTICPRFDVSADPAGFARLAEKRSLKRHASRLAREGRVDVEHLDDVGAILDELPTFFRQHIERWAVTRTPSLFLDPAARALYEELVRHGAPRGSVILSIVRVKGRAVAYHLGFIHCGRLIWYKPSFDIRFHRASPGEVLLQSTIVFASKHGLRELDLTRGDEAYKSRFSNGARRNANWIWFRDGALQRRFLTERAFRHALRRPLSLIRENGVLGARTEAFDDAWIDRGRRQGSLPRRLRHAAARAARALVELHRFATCVPSGTAPGRSSVTEASLDGLLEGSDLEPDTPRTAAISEAYGRMRAGSRGLMLRRDGRTAAALWYDADGRVDRVRSLDGRLTSEDLRDLVRAAAAESGRPSGAIEVRLGGGLDRRALARAGLAVVKTSTSWSWLDGRHRRNAGGRS